MCDSYYAPPRLPQVGDVTCFKDHGLGRIENEFLWREGRKVYGEGPFEIIAVSGTQITIRTPDGEEGEVPALWLKLVST